MTDDLDDWLADLAAAPLERPLDRLETELGCDIARRRRDARTLKALAPVRLGAVSLALALGVTAGTAAAMTAMRAAPASAGLAVAELAPSTLLDGAR